MANNGKKFCDISYSLRIGSSTYYVLGRRMKTPKYRNTYFLSEDAATRTKSTKVSATSSAYIQRSKTPRRSISPERRPKKSHYPRVNTVNDLTTKQQQQETNQTCHHRRTRSRSKKRKQITDKTRKTERKVSNDSFRQKMTEEKNPLIKSNKKERKGFIQATVTEQKQEIIRLFDEQKRSFAHLLEEQLRTTNASSTELIKQIVTETLTSQQPLSTKELEHTLIQTIQQVVEKTLSKNDDKSQSNQLDTNAITRLQDILIQTIEKYIASTNKYDSVTLNRLFAEQKQVLVETLAQQQQQQQLTPSIDQIKQAVNDALSEYNSTSITTNTTTSMTNHRKSAIKIINHEVKITADLKHTRIDAAFRQQRDTVVANRYLRDTVRQWSNVRSISSLIKKIQACSTNDLENAWLLFCWIGQNIRYDFYCQNNSAESVFQHRTGACLGFVNLYHQCCSLLSIQCSEISGYTKQNFLKQNEDLKKSSHIWNAIVLDQYTYLVDSTWGAGGGDNTNELEDFYFLTSPEELIYTHYSNDYQLLKPEITKQEFLSLPIMKSNYYRLNLNLLSPKQGFNQTYENIFKISIKTPGYVDLYASLKIDNNEYPRHLHTLCQRDIIQTDRINCFLAPPIDGLYEIIIYAKTNDETVYRDTIYMRLNVSNMIQAITFPIIYQSFNEYKCILIEPFQRLVQENERVFIHMKIPDANIIKIQNGNDYIVPTKDEYKNGLLKKEINVQGNLHICARWDDKTDKILTICVFNMI